MNIVPQHGPTVVVDSVEVGGLGTLGAFKDLSPIIHCITPIEEVWLMSSLGYSQ